MEGYTGLKVAKLLNVSDSMVRYWLNRYNASRLEGLIPQKPKGLECKLTAEQLNEVYQALSESSKEHGFNKSNWKMPVLKIWLSRKFGVNYALCSLYDLIHRIGYSMQRPKKQCRNADPMKQEVFKQELKELVEDSDEPTTTRKWALVGKQPIVHTNSKGSRKRKVVFGACNLKAGEVVYSAEEAGNFERVLILMLLSIFGKMFVKMSHIFTCLMVSVIS